MKPGAPTAVRRPCVRLVVPVPRLRLLRLDAGRGAGLRGGRASGSALAAASIGLVYGGGDVGLMGVLADAVLGGRRGDRRHPRVPGADEVAHRGLTELHVVGSMHERKALMADLADAFIALPAASARSTSCARS